MGEFKRGLTNFIDNERSGRPKTATISDNIENVRQSVIDNGRIKVREITGFVGTSKEHFSYIMTEELLMKKLTMRCVPRLLIFD